MGSPYNKLFQHPTPQCLLPEMFTDEINKGMVSIYHSGKTLTIHQHVIIPESVVQTGIATSAPGLANNNELFENSFGRAGKDEIVTRFS